MGVALESLAVSQTVKTRMRRKAEAARGKGERLGVYSCSLLGGAMSSQEVLGACTPTGSSPVMAALPDCQSLGGLKDPMGGTERGH